MHNTLHNLLLIRVGLPVAILWLLSQAAIAQQATDNCRECPLPASMAQYAKMDLIFDNGAALVNCTSIKRIIINKYEKEVQALEVHFERGGNCIDTILELATISKISYGGLSLRGNPVTVPILPARECYKTAEDISTEHNFIAVTPFIGYGGKDTSHRAVGYSSFYYGLEAAWAPFGTMLGERIALALSGALLFEGGRMRIPVGGKLRWTFLGNQRKENTASFIPGPCAFTQEGDTSSTSIPQGYIEVPSDRATDPNVLYVRDQKIVKDPFRPFVYLEGGTIFNGSGDNLGKEPSVNPEEYSQYYLGAGVGVPFASSFVATLGYRYMRLNQRTPCIVCPNDFFVQNTSTSHSVLLTVGINLPY